MDQGERWYQTVYDAHATQLLAYFLRRVPEDHAHDLVAEVFVVAWRRRATAPGGPDLRPWLFKVAPPDGDVVTYVTSVVVAHVAVPGNGDPHEPAPAVAVHTTRVAHAACRRVAAVSMASSGPVV